MIESCFGNHLNVQHATDYMGTYLMYLWAINVIVIIDLLTPDPKPIMFIMFDPALLNPCLLLWGCSPPEGMNPH